MGYHKIEQTYDLQVRSKITLRLFSTSAQINDDGFDYSTRVR